MTWTVGPKSYRLKLLEKMHTEIRWLSVRIESKAKSFEQSA